MSDPSEMSISPDPKVKVTYAARRRRSRSVASRASRAPENSDNSDDEKMKDDTNGSEPSKDMAEGGNGSKSLKQRLSTKDEDMMPPPKTPKMPKTPKTPRPASKGRKGISRSPSTVSLKPDSGDSSGDEDMKDDADDIESSIDKAEAENGSKSLEQRSSTEDVDLMPPPKTPKTPKPTSKARKGISRSPSTASLKADGDVTPASVSRSLSAVGKAKAQLAARMQPQTPEGSADDVLSPTGESSRSRVRKSEAERREFLERDPLSGEVQPHRVFCTMCGQWVELNPKLRYIMKLWLEHRKKCAKDHGKERDAVSEAAGDDDEDAVSIAPSEKSTRSVKASGPSRPSARVATAERKLTLVNDLQVKSFTTSSVECTVCRTSVALAGDGEYNLTEWENHKKACVSRSPVRPAVPAAAAAVHSPAALAPPASAAKEGSGPPPSTASTDATAIGSEVTPTGGKRAREDDDEGEERVVRPRTEAYRAPQGFLEKLAMPFKSFVEGFRQGLTGL